MIDIREGTGAPRSRGLGFAGVLPAALGVLRRSVAEMLDTFWDPACQERVCEQALALAQAAKIEGLPRLSALARAIASIGFMERSEALEIRTEVEDTLGALLAEMAREGAPEAGRETG